MYFTYYSIGGVVLYIESNRERVCFMNFEKP